MSFKKENRLFLQIIYIVDNFKERVIFMQKIMTVKEWLFALGIYPSLEAIEKFSLFFEMIESSARVKYPKEDLPPSLFKSGKIKKLSQKKKASFTSFLEKLDVAKEMAKYEKQGIKWVTILSEDYPFTLKQIFSPPIVLFYKGNFELIKKHTWLGVVGARACTEYGLEATEHILQPLIKKSEKEIGVVSGLAKGIDTKAHQVTLDASGSTIGVIGTGLDRYYPFENRTLQRKMIEKQLVVSEYPIGAKPLKFHFPERNRIIAGLSRGILVVEAKKRSGSLITAYNALDEGRDVFAVPGSIFEQTTDGCHRLIQLGGILTKESEDILKEWMYI